MRSKRKTVGAVWTASHRWETFTESLCLLLLCSPLTGRASTAGAGGGTPGTAAGRGSTAGGGGGARSSYPVVVLVENRSRQVGIASVDLCRLFAMDLIQIADNQSYTQTMAYLQVRRERGTGGGGAQTIAHLGIGDARGGASLSRLCCADVRWAAHALAGGRWR